MTAPAPEQQQPQQQTPPPPPEQPEDGQPMTDAAIVAGIAVLLAAATAAATAGTVAPIVALLMRRPERRDEPQVPRIVAIAVTQLVLRQTPPNGGGRLGEAGRRMQRLNILRRAQYVLAAARRVTRQLGTDRSREAVAEALRREQQFWRQHQEASTKRTQAAAVADSVAQQHGVPTRRGTILGWHAENDERTTGECRAAHGKNWIVERPPRIGIPGTVHVHCRCRPVAPWPTRQLVGGGQLTKTPR